MQPMGFEFALMDEGCASVPTADAHKNANLARRSQALKTAGMVMQPMGFEFALMDDARMSSPAMALGGGAAELWSAEDIKMVLIAVLFGPSVLIHCRQGKHRSGAFGWGAKDCTYVPIEDC